MSELLTIGHSTHPIDAFIALLKQHSVTALADVRSHPYSRHFPQYSKDALNNALAQAQIAYVFLGKELGAEVKTLLAIAKERCSTTCWPRNPCLHKV